MLWAIAAFGLGVQFALPPGLTTLELVRLGAQFCVIVGFLEVLGFTLQSEQRSGTRLFFGLLGSLAGALILSNATFGVSNVVHGQYYVLGLITLTCGLAVMLDLGSGDWWCWGRSVLGLIHFGLGVVLLVHPFLSVLDSMVMVGILFMLASLFAILLLSELRPSSFERPAEALAGILPAAIASRQKKQPILHAKLVMGHVGSAPAPTTSQTSTHSSE
ncbi:MAG: DUF308 domain-containing protein [Longimicrobiales bacterium]